MESTTETANSTKSASAGREERRGDYSHVRPQIQDGDVLLWRGNYATSIVFRFLTRSPYTHAAIAARWGDRLMILQAELVGIQAVPLSATVKRYNGLVDWYRIKDEYRSAVDKVLAKATGDLGRAFGIVAVIRSTWKRFLRATGIVHRRLGLSLNPKSPRARAMFCSQYVSSCFRAGGLQLTSRPDIDTLPGDIKDSDVLEFQVTIHDR
jgi:hypothetical protein